ncbi:MAG: carboxypeptidase-like regulatory domain-containing protein [Bacteroidota bacterium]
MNKKLKRSILLFVPFFPILFLLFLAGCESSRVGPELPRPNPPAPTPQPMILASVVRDNSNLTAIPAATIRILRADNTIVTTLLTDNSGRFSYDVSNITETSLSVSASKAGYGIGTKTAELRKALNIALVDDILLTKLTVATTTVTPATGGTATTSNPQTVSATPLTVTVPPAAVPQNITLTVAAIPAAQVPKPPSANQAIQTAAVFGPSGTVFSVPVQVKMPLPNRQPAGKTYTLLKLNEANNTWASTGITATVDATGTNITAQLSSFSTYGTADDITLTTTTGTPTTQDIDNVTLSSGTTTKSYSQTNSSSVTVTGTVNNQWILDVVNAATRNKNFGTTTKQIQFNFPAVPNEYIRNGVQYNPANPNEAGNWVYRWVVTRTTQTTTCSASGGVAPNNYSATVTIVEQTINIDAARSGWVWVKHDQGG